MLTISVNLVVELPDRKLPARESSSCADTPANTRQTASTIPLLISRRDIVRIRYISAAKKTLAEYFYTNLRKKKNKEHKSQLTATGVRACGCRARVLLEREFGNPDRAGLHRLTDWAPLVGQGADPEARDTKDGRAE